MGIWWIQNYPRLWGWLMGSLRILMYVVGCGWVWVVVAVILVYECMCVDILCVDILCVYVTRVYVMCICTCHFFNTMPVSCYTIIPHNHTIQCCTSIILSPLIMTRYPPFKTKHHPGTHHHHHHNNNQAKNQHKNHHPHVSQTLSPTSNESCMWTHMAPSSPMTNLMMNQCPTWMPRRAPPPGRSPFPYK